MLRAALDATPLLGSRTGIGVAVAATLGALAAREELSLTGYGLTFSGWGKLTPLLPGGVAPARAPMPAGALMRTWARVDHPSIEWWTGEVDLVHGTNYVVPPTLRAKRLVTVADLAPLRYPELCAPTSLRYPRLLSKALARGAWVHTWSRHVAEEMIEHFRVEPARVRVVYPGAGSIPDASDRDGLVHCSPGRSAQSSSQRPYVLGVGTVEPRKDFPSLVRAFDELAGEHPEVELRIAGPRGWGEAELAATIAASSRRDRIHRLGWVPDVEGLLAGAAVFCYPSVYEGFGFPPIEAMAMGVPVVATASGAVPEVVGDAASLVPLGDTNALASALTKALFDSEHRARLVEAGRKRAAEFTWASTADSMIVLYRHLIEGHG